VVDHPEAANQRERERVRAEAGEEVDEPVAQVLSRCEARHLDVEHEQRDRHRHDAVGEGGDAAEVAPADLLGGLHGGELSRRAGWSPVR
jgi:hypothetical protein